MESLFKEALNFIKNLPT